MNLRRLIFFVLVLHFLFSSTASSAYLFICICSTGICCSNCIGLAERNCQKLANQHISIAVQVLCRPIVHFPNCSSTFEHIYIGPSPLPTFEHISIAVQVFNFSPPNCRSICRCVITLQYFLKWLNFRKANFTPNILFNIFPWWKCGATQQSLNCRVALLASGWERLRGK